MKRTILIIGSSSGIGHSIKDHLRAIDHQIIGVARRYKNPTQVDGFIPISFDLENLDKLESFGKRLSKEYPSIDGIICNAGKGYFGHLEELSSDKMRSLMDLNFMSHAILVKTLLPHLKKQNRSDIIFIGSEAALVAKKKSSIYSASKFALRGFAQALRQECSTSNVHVSMIQPGMTTTPFYDDLSFSPKDEPYHSLEPEDVAKTVEMILSLKNGSIVEEILLRPQKSSLVKKINNKISC